LNIVIAPPLFNLLLKSFSLQHMSQFAFWHWRRTNWGICWSVLVVVG